MGTTRTAPGSLSAPRLACAIALAIAVVACAGPPAPPAAQDAGRAVVRRPIETPQPAPAATQPPAEAARAQAAIPTDIPPGALYVCVTETGGQRRSTSIEFAPKVDALCRRHPEMGPCQYERETCRRNGGRVFAADGREITRQVEAEYDRKVMRVRFRAS